MERAKRKGLALLYLRGAMIFLALLLPLLSLLPLGWYWLWQNGYALYWLAAAFAISACALLVQIFALRRSVAQTPITTLTEDASATPADPGWTAREQAAWAAVETIAADVRPDALTDRDKVPQLGPAHDRSRRARDPSARPQSAVEVHDPGGAGTGRTRQRRSAPVRDRQRAAGRPAHRGAGSQDLSLALGGRLCGEGLRHLAPGAPDQPRDGRGPGGTRADHQAPLRHRPRPARAAADARLRARGRARRHRSLRRAACVCRSRRSPVT